MTTVCQICGKVMQLDDGLMNEARRPFLGNPLAMSEIHRIEQKWLPMVGHDACIAQREQESRSIASFERRKGLVARWNKACPPIFLETSFDLIPFAEKVGALNAIAEGHSVMLIGPTRRGKTRLAWEACRPVFMSGKQVMIFTHIGLSTEIREQADKGPNWLSTLVHRLKGCDLLFLDDFGKAKMVGADGVGMQNEEALFDVLDCRVSQKKQTIITANDVGHTLESRMSERGVPLVARLREFFKQFTG